MTGDQYLYSILAREAVNIGPASPARAMQAILTTTIRKWANKYLLTIHPSGSFMKGTANRSGTDIDLFISLSEDTPETLKEIHDKLFTWLSDNGYTPKRQNVSLNIKVLGVSVDLVPAKRQNAGSLDHSLYVSKAKTWKKTNVLKHIVYVRGAGRQSESRILKLWRDQCKLDFPSFYLEMVVARALSGEPPTSTTTLANNVSRVFEFLRDSFVLARFVDPANSNNVLSDELTFSEKATISAAGKKARETTYWEDILK